jgi:hypothetical protein
MPQMFAPHSTVTRSLAIVLPLAFVWAFVACASLCSEHASQVIEARVSFGAEVSATDAPADARCSERWQCPFGSAPPSALPERPSFASPEISIPLVAACLPPSQPAIQGATAQPDLFSSPPYISPPLESLRALRI